MIEAGARFEDEDFAASTFDVEALTCAAPSSAATASSASTPSRDRLIVAGAGVGGGSLVYANTLYEPLEPFYSDPQWADITDWKSELAPYYDQAKRMLGVVENPVRTPADDVMEKVADRHGRGRHLPPDPGRASSSAAPARPGRAGRRPLLRRRRPRPQHLHQLRRLHDRAAATTPRTPW